MHTSNFGEVERNAGLTSCRLDRIEEPFWILPVPLCQRRAKVDTLDWRVRIEQVGVMTRRHVQIADRLQCLLQTSRANETPGAHEIRINVDFEALHRLLRSDYSLALTLREARYAPVRDGL